MSDKFIPVYAGALTAADIGKRVELRLLNGTEIRGQLAEVEHKAEQIDEGRIGDASYQDRLGLGEAFTHLTLLGVRDRFTLRTSSPIGLNPVRP